MKERRADLVNAVKTPLGFFSLVIIVSESLLFVFILKLSPHTQSMIAIAMIIFLFSTMLIVALLCFFKPRSLGLYTHSEQEQSGHQPARVETIGHDKYDGHYECYHKSTAQEPTVIRSYAYLKLDDEDNPVCFESFKYKYKGKFTLDDSNMYFFLDGDGHTEHMLLLFNEPLSLEFDILTGIFAAVTEERMPAIGKMLWRKSTTPVMCERIPLKDVDPRIRKFLDQDGNPMIVHKPTLPFFKYLET